MLQLKKASSSLLLLTFQLCTSYTQAADATGGTTLSDTFGTGTYYTCGLRLDSSILCWGSNDYGQTTVPIGNYTALSVSGWHVCGLQTDSSIKCWGNNDSGQTTVPTGTYSALATGGLHSCGLQTDGISTCWGSNQYGQTVVPTGTYTALSAGGWHTCGLQSNGVLKCWGYNNYVPVGTYTAVSAGRLHTCGLKTDGTLNCWGDNLNGQTNVPPGTYIAVSAGSYHTCGLQSGGVLKCWGGSGTDANGANINEGQINVPAGTYTAVKAGRFHTCGLQSNGILTCWGRSTEGQTNVPPGMLRMLVQAGLNHSCALKLDGTLACWGDNSYTQTAVPTGTFKALSAGSRHNCGVKSNNTVFCWGDDSYGQATPPTGNFHWVNAGDLHTCGLKDNGTLTCWGDTAFGQTTAPAGIFLQLDAGDNHTCGIKTDNNIICWGNNAAQQAIPPSDVFMQVSAGTDHSCGIKTDNTIACWGNNAYQQGTPPAGSFNQVSAGNWHTCGIKADNTITCWGENSEGQATSPPGKFAQISVNQHHSCGLKADGTVLCWGANNYGQTELPTLAVTKAGGIGTGTLVSDPTGIDCGTTCTGTFARLGQVTLTATPNSNSVFNGWSGACTNMAGACILTMDTNRNANATFKLQSLTTPPVLVNAIGANQRIILTWNAVTGATNYVLYQGTSPNGELATPIRAGLPGTTFTIPNLTNGIRYYFKLQAANAGGVSNLSNELNAVPVPPPLPPTIRITPAPSQVTLNWNAISGAVSYNVYQGTSANGENPVPVQTGITGTAATITGLIGGTRYFFKMKSVGNSGDLSTFSNEVNAIPPPPAPSAPVLQSAVSGNTQITLTWNAVATANTYNVYRGVSAGGENPVPVKTGVTGTTVTITGLFNNTTYYFKMAAVNAGGVSPYSNEVSATPLDGPQDGACGSSNGGTFPSVPTTGFCNQGDPTPVTGTGPWTWTCDGLNGGNAANCSANAIGILIVTPSVTGENGTISPNTPQNVARDAKARFTATPNLGYIKDLTVGGTCPSGNWNGDRWTTGPITNHCTVIFNFTEPPTAWLNPSNPIATVGSSLALDLRVDSKGAKVNNYNFDVKFDQLKLIVQENFQDDSGQCVRGICPGTDALIPNSSTVDNTTGSIKLMGFHSAGGQGPGNDLQLVVIHFTIRQTLGITPVTLTLNQLNSDIGDPIGNGLTRNSSVNIQRYKCGDANGDTVINIIDALGIARQVLGLEPPPAVTIAADVNGDADISIVDAMHIARYSVGLVVVNTCLSQ